MFGDSHIDGNGFGAAGGSVPEPTAPQVAIGSNVAPSNETHAIANLQPDAAFLTVPDADLLFSAEFKRTGSDLTLIGSDGRKFIIFDYFRYEKLPDLVSPNGATLSANLVEKLAGSIAPNQYAQATAPSSSAQVIGKVEKLTGSVIVVRNGAAVTVNVGDALNKTDIVQTSSDSTVGISLLDGTVMNLSANTRMALNEFLYDVSAASGNGGHFSLIQGAFAFVSGLVAKTGGLNIETSVAVIGIRGTVGGAACADAGHCEYYAAPEISGPNAGQPSTFALLTGGRFVNGQYVGGTPVGTVTVGANAQVAATGVNTPPQVTFVAAANADPALSALTQQLIQFYPQVTTPTQAPTQAPQGPPGPPGINPQSAPSSPGGSSSPPPPPDPSPLLKNDNPNDLHPLASIPAPTEVVVVVPTITPTGQTDVVVTVTIAPVTSAVTLANGPSISSVSSTSGPVVNGGSTNDPNPTIAVSVSGTDAVAGNTVQLFDGTAPLGNAHTLTTSEVTSGIANVHTGLLSDGTYHITASVTDTSGNPSFSAPFVVIEDTTPPTAPTIVVTDNVNPVTGALANGATTNDPDLMVTVSVSGTGAVSGDTIQLYNGNSPLGGPHVLTAAEITGGSADLQTGTLSDGATYNITARITDVAGNQSSSSAILTVTESGIVPVVTDISIADTAQKDAGSIVASGNLFISNPGSTNSISEIQGAGDASTVAVMGSGSVAHGTYGNLTIQADGGYSYQATQAIDALNFGDQKNDVFSFTISDGSTAVTLDLTFHITGTNDLPLVANPIQNQNIDEDSSWAFTIPANTFSDAEGLPLTLAATLAGGAPLPNWLNFDPATGTFSGTPPLNANGSVPLEVVVSDGTSSVANFFTLNVLPINDAPVVVNGGSVSLASINENAVDPLGTTIASLLTGQFSDAADEVPGGSHANSLAGFAIYSNSSNPAGVWQWSLGGGTWNDIPTNVSESNAFVLAVSTQVRFVPASGFFGEAPTLTGHLIDDSAGPVSNNSTVNLFATGVGGTTQYSTDSVSVGETVVAVDQAPVIGNAGNTIGYTELQAVAPAIDAALTVSDVDSATLASATVSITGGLLAGDVLNFTNQNGITGSYSGGVLTLSGTATVAQYQAALESVTFSSSSHNPTSFGTDSSRSISWVVSDGPQSSNLATTTINITAVNDAPVITGVSGSVSTNQNTPVTLIAPSGTVTDADAAAGDLLLATLSVAHGTLTPLGNVPGLTIVNGQDGSSGILSFTGTQTAITQAIETGVSYTPALNFTGSDQLTVTVNDQGHTGTGGAQTTTAAIGITVSTDQPPVLSNVAPSAAYTEAGPAVTLSSALAVSDIDNTTLASATVTISSGLLAGDVLSVAGATSGTINGITWGYANGVLSFNGSSSLANYQTLLDQVQYASSSQNPTNFGADSSRSISWVVNDGTVNSSQASTTVNITPVDQAPVIGNAGNTIGYTELQAVAPAIDAALTVSDVDSATLASATVSITGGLLAGDVLNFTNQNGITGSYSGGVLTLSGTATVAQYQAALESVTFSSSSHNPTSFGTDSSRSISWVVSDGPQSSNLATTTINITAVNDAPILASGSVLGYTENGPAAAINTAIAVSDVDNITLASATVSITTNFAASQDILSFVNDGLTMGNITGVYNGSTGVLNFTSTGATATLQQWQAALHAVSYSNSSDNPSAAARTVSFQVNDGAANSNAVTSTVNVTPVNDAPTLTATALNPTFAEAAGLGTQAAAVFVFSSANASTIETGQTFRGLVFTVGGLADGANEAIVVDGTTIALGSNSSGVTATNALGYTVGIVGGTASVVLTSAAGISTANLDTLTNGIAYLNTNTDNPTAGSRIFTLTLVQDTGGTTNGGSDTTALSIVSTVTVVAVDDPPVNTMPTGPLTVSENTALSFTGSNTISVHDIDNNLTSTQLTVLNGTLNVSLAGGASISAGTNGSNTLTLSGTETQIDAVLATLSYQGGPNFIGGDTLTVLSTDGGALTDSDTVSIIVQNPNEDDWVVLSGNWGIGTNWNHGLPSPTTTAVINEPGIYTVTSSGTVTIDTLTSIPTATLSITGGTFTVANFTGQGPLVLSAGTFNIGSSTATVGTFTQTGGELNGSGTLTVTGPTVGQTTASNFSAGTESGSGTTTAQNGATFTSTGFGLDGGRLLQLGGASTTSGTSVSISLNSANPNTGVSDPGSGTLTILSGATFTDATTGGLTISAVSHGVGDDGTAAAMNNAGTFTKTNTGTSTISTLFNNTGIVDVQAGTLNLSGGGTDVGATYKGVGTIEFGGGVRTLDATSSITGNALFAGGATTFTTINGGVGTGLMTVTAGTATFNGTVSTGGLTQSGGELNGSGTLTVTGPTVGQTTASNFSAGTESGSGTTTAQNGATFTSTGFGLDGGRLLQLGGASTTSGTSVSISLNSANPNTGVSDPGSGTLTILSGATFTDATTGGLTISAVSHGVGDDGTAAAMNNAGTFTKTNIGTSTISTRFNNTGIVDVQAGTLSLTGGGTDSGTYNVASGATVQFNSAYTLNGTSSTGLGHMQLVSNTVTVASATNFASGFTQSGGELNGSGTLTVTGGSNFSAGTESGSGTTTAQNGATFTSTGFGLDGGRLLQLGGASTTSGTSVSISLNSANPNTGVSDPGSGTLTILSGATFTDATTGGLTISAVSHGVGDDGTAAAMNNAGTFTKTNIGTSTISTRFNNTGIVDVQAGTLNLSGGGTDVGATYKGVGTIEFGGGVRTLDATSSITGNALFAGGATTFTTINGGVGTGLMTVTAGTATFNGTVSTGGLTQSGGELNGSGTLTVTGPTVGQTTASNFSAGTESGSGTTTAQNGATFTSTGFGLDGGRLLQLGGASTTSGTSVSISLNSANPNTGVSDPGSGTLTILSGATFTDATTGGLTISAVSHGVGDDGTAAAMNNAGTFTKTNTGTSTISTLFNNTGTVNVQSGMLDFGLGGTNLSATYSGTGNIEITGGTWTFSGNNLIETATLNNLVPIIITNGSLNIASPVTGTGSFTIGSASLLELGGSAAQTITFSGGGGTLKLDNPTPTSFTGHINGLGIGDIIDLTNTTVTNAVINGSTLSLTVSGGQTLTYQVAGSLAGNAFATQSDGAGGSELVLTDAAPSFWGNIYFPSQLTQGVHLFSGKVDANPFTGAVGLLYASTGPTPTYDPINDPSGPYPITRGLLPLDPFFLPTLAGNQVVMPAATPITLPARNNFILPSVNTVNGINAEGIAIFETQDGGGNNVLDVVTATGSSGGQYSPLTISAPIQIENAGTNTIYNLDASFRQDNGTPPASYLSTYSVAWDQYDSSTQTYSLRFQIFNPGGSPSDVITPPITSINATSLTASASASAHGTTALPAWSFRNGGGIYTLAIGEHNSVTNKDFIQFQGYNTDGTANTSDATHLESFQVQANLNAYVAGATNQITQDIIPSLSPTPGNPTQQLMFAQASGNNANDWLIGWNETVNDSGGNFLGDQVEFAVVKSGSGVIFRYTDQLSDAQNIRIANYTDLSGNDFAVFAYGDSTATHLVDFKISGGGSTVTQVALVVDPTTQPFSNIVSLGDGRIEVSYNDVLDSSQTSQLDLKIFDFRTTGLHIDDSAATDGQNKYIAGTHFSDAFTGENNVNNLYYYVGQNGTVNPPSDTFHGGTNGSNIAIFPDSRANYTIQAQIDGTTLITNVHDSAHSGSLTVDDNVQALAFLPAHDPVPHNDGSVEATGGTLVILSNNFSNAGIIDPGATLEFIVAEPNAITFLGSTGELVLDQPASFNGQIIGFTGDGTLSGSDQIDLVGIDRNSTNFHDAYSNGILTVSDGAHTANLHFTGNYSLGNFKFASDGVGGTIVYDPPLDSSSSTSVPAPTNQTPSAVLAPFGGSTPGNAIAAVEPAATGRANDTFIFKPGFGADTIVNAKSTDIIGLDGFSSVASGDQLQFYLSEAQNNQPQSVFQAANGGHDTVISLGNNDVVTLANVHLADLHGSNFIIH